MRNTLSSKLLFCILVCVGLVARAEEHPAPSTTEIFREAHGDFLRLATGEGKDIEFRFTQEPSHDFEKSEETELSLSQFLVSADLPLILSRDTFIRTSVTFDSRLYRFNHLILEDNNEITNATLYRGLLGIGAGHFINDELLITGLVTPGIFSTFSSPMSSEHINVYGELFAVYSYTKNFEIISGVVTDELFDNPRVYPVLATRWRNENDTLRIKFSPPVSARVGYTLAPSTELYTIFTTTGDRYRVAIARVSREFDVQIHEKRAGIGVLQFLTKHFNISVEGGVTFLNTFDIKFSADSEINDTTNSSAYMFVSFGYAL